MKPDRRLLEAHRRVERDGRRGLRERRDRLLPLPLLDRWLRRGRTASSEAGLPGRVERSSERIVERPKPDLVTGGDLPAGADESCTGPPLL